MQPIFRVLLVVPAFALTACATSPQFSVADTGPGATEMTTEQVPLTAPAQATATAAATMDVSAFIDPAAYGQMSAKSKTEAAGAQFNALQFGRVGAPRNWYGDNGQSGAVTVGPYVRVNLIDCRDFTHTVTLSGQSFVRKGTACREADGTWTVTPAKTG